MKTIFYFIALFIILTSCSSFNEPLTLKSSIDEKFGWAVGTPSIVCEKDKAHSGIYSSKIDSINQYSFGFEDLIANIKMQSISKIKFSAWVFLEKVPTEIAIVGQIKEGDKTIIWQGTPIKDKVTNLNKWTKVEAEITIPEVLNDNARFATYFFTSKKDEIAYIDDFEITFE